jgi:molecular chaperone HscB
MGPHICSSCGKLLQPGADSDYFSVFGLPRKLRIDLGALEQKFLQLSWKLHPDNFVNAPEGERERSLKKSSELNDAYRVLQDPLARVEYLLHIEGERNEGEKKQQAPPELLEEVFELNESLDELREAKGSGLVIGELKAKLQAAETNFQEKLGELDTQVMMIAREWDDSVDSGTVGETRKKQLGRMNDLLNRRSYLRNLVTNVAKELAEA